MKQSEVNLLCREASACFERMDGALPPNPQWAATDADPSVNIFHDIELDEAKQSLGSSAETEA